MHDGQKAAQNSAHEAFTSPGGQSLPANRRLKRRAEYQAVFSRNRQYSGRHFRVLVHKARSQLGARLGIVVSRRVSKKAVERNRIKRQVRECFRTNRHKLIDHDIVVIAHRSCESVPNGELRDNLIKLFSQLEN